jgi:hypothetical protein
MRILLLQGLSITKKIILIVVPLIIPDKKG